MAHKCGGCAAAKAARAAKRQAAGETTGNWSVTFLDGKRFFFETKLAAMAYDQEFASSHGGRGMIRPVG